MANSQQIRDRFIEIIKANELDETDELEIFKALFEKHNFRSVKKFADDSGVSPQWIYQQIKERKMQFIEVNGFKLCF